MRLFEMFRNIFFPDLCVSFLHGFSYGYVFCWSNKAFRTSIRVYRIARVAIYKEKEKGKGSKGSLAIFGVDYFLNKNESKNQCPR